MASVEIPLTQGQVAIIDEADLELVGKYRWHARKTPTTYYAVGRIPGTSGNKTAMHRLIMNAPSHAEVDHRDCNGLNNTRDNLRLCSRQGNARNMRRQSTGRSRFKGVSLQSGRAKYRNRWTAQIGVSPGVKRFIGRFPTEHEAAEAYDHVARKLFGEFANLNFPAHGG